MKQELRTLPGKTTEYKHDIRTRDNINGHRRQPFSMWLSFGVLAAGLTIAIISYYQVVPMHYMIGPYALNHWAGWLSFGFIAVYVPIFTVLRKRNPATYRKLIKLHQMGFLTAFIIASLHIGWQISIVFPPELGTGIAMYVSLFVLVVSGITMRYRLLAKRMRTLRFLHQGMVASFFLVMVFHIIRALIFLGHIQP